MRERERVRYLYSGTKKRTFSQIVYNPALLSLYASFSLQIPFVCRRRRIHYFSDKCSILGRYSVARVFLLQIYKLTEHCFATTAISTSPPSPLPFHRLSFPFKCKSDILKSAENRSGTLFIALNLM